MTKSFTDIEQSKKLADILPLESADMVWVDYGYCKRILPKDDIDARAYPVITLAWSLVALLEAMPKTLEYGRPILCTNYEGFYFVQYRDASMDYVNGTNCYDNPIDACMKMIFELNKIGV